MIIHPNTTGSSDTFDESHSLEHIQSVDTRPEKDATRTVPSNWQDDDIMTAVTFGDERFQRLLHQIAQRSVLQAWKTMPVPSPEIAPSVKFVDVLTPSPAFTHSPLDSPFRESFTS